MLKFRPADINDADLMYPRLRLQDYREVELTMGPDVLSSLRLSIELSEVCLVAEDEDGIICIFGIARTEEGAGSPWMLGTDSLLKYSKEMVSITRPWVQKMLVQYKLFYNFVHTENSKSKKWLKALGFTLVEETVPYGAAKAPFHLFYMVDTDV